MSANVPVVRPISWPAVLILTLLSIIFISVFALIFDSDGIMIGAIVFAALSIVLQAVIARSHKKGMRAIKRNDFEAGIGYFQDSADFFTRNSWIDKYRAITMLSASKMSYREMALCNIAFCYSQTMQAEKAKALYEQILQEFPDNGIAYYSLNSINTFSNKPEENNNMSSEM